MPFPFLLPLQVAHFRLVEAASNRKVFERTLGRQKRANMVGPRGKRLGSQEQLCGIVDGSGNVLIETSFFDDELLVCKMVLRVFYDL